MRSNPAVCLSTANLFPSIGSPRVRWEGSKKVPRKYNRHIDILVPLHDHCILGCLSSLLKFFSFFLDDCNKTSNSGANYSLLAPIAISTKVAARLIQSANKAFAVPASWASFGTRAHHTFCQFTLILFDRCAFLFDRELNVTFSCVAMRDVRGLLRRWRQSRGWRSWWWLRIASWMAIRLGYS